MIIMDIFHETMLIILTSNMMMWKSLKALALQLHGNWYRAGQQGRGTCYSARAKGAHGTVHGQKGHMVQYMGRRGTVYRGTVYGQLGHTVQRAGAFCISRYSTGAGGHTVKSAGAGAQCISRYSTWGTQSWPLLQHRSLCLGFSTTILTNFYRCWVSVFSSILTFSIFVNHISIQGRANGQGHSDNLDPTPWVSQPQFSPKSTDVGFLSNYLRKCLQMLQPNCEVVV